MSSHDVPLTLLDPEGGWINAPVHVHELRGRPTLLYFWSELSKTNQEQLPKIKALLDEFVPKGLQVIGVHVPMDGEDLEHALDTRRTALRPDAAFLGEALRGLPLGHRRDRFGRPEQGLMLKLPLIGEIALQPGDAPRRDGGDQQQPADEQSQMEVRR